jgi:UDPglucose--hexose-1-phosphate uridylyltransferase
MEDEIRKDIFERDVVIATSRSKRPGAFLQNHSREKACPFCPGNEKLTEKTLLALPDEKNWKVRVLKNKYPVLYKRSLKPVTENFYSTFTPCGAHEILIETRGHDREYFNMPEKDIVLIIKALKERHKQLMKIPDVNYVTIFKNKGERGGASLAHPHMQIIASPIFPHKISEEMHESENYFKEEKKCAYCAIIHNEVKVNKRIVYRNSDWVVICPFVSRWPYQTTILPKRHFSDLSEIGESEMRTLAKTTRHLFYGYSKLFNDPPYNMMYHNFPQSDFWHFHISVYPRLITPAGFEFFGLNVNITQPEQAARDLKKAIG